MDQRRMKVIVQVSPAANQLLALLHKQRVKMTHLRATDKQLTFIMNKKDLATLRSARKQSKAKITLHYINQEAVLQRTGVTLLGIIICLLLPLLASQFIWRVEIDGATPELTKKVSTYLVEELHVQAPLVAKDFPTEMMIRQQLMATFPELAWVHFAKQAGDIQLTLQLAPKIETKQTATSGYLVAKTAGVITHHFLTAGQLLVAVNETVETGDVLVSGVIEGEKRSVMTGASGEVYADYWLETSFSMPRQMKYYTAKAGEWTFVTDDKSAQQELTLPKWVKKYIRIVKRPSYTLHERLLGEEDMESVILPLLQTKFLQSMPLKTTIKSEKVLHLSIDNDTVKGQVLYLVNENIAQPIPMKQGD